VILRDLNLDLKREMLKATSSDLARHLETMKDLNSGWLRVIMMAKDLLREISSVIKMDLHSDSRKGLDSQKEIKRDLNLARQKGLKTDLDSLKAIMRGLSSGKHLDLMRVRAMRMVRHSDLMRD